MKFHPRSRSELLQLLALVGVVLALPLPLPSGPGEGEEKMVPFDRVRYEKSARRKPDVVMIGNSMLNTRVDKPLFDALAEPNSISYVAEGGTRSTVWYFKFKNFAVPLNPVPKVVFIFYRDYDFTAPWLHLEGERLETARTFMRPEDEELLDSARRLGGVAPDSPLDAYLPEQMTVDVRRRLNNLAIDIGAAGNGRTGDTALQENLNDLFDFENLRADVFDAGALANDLVPAETKVFTVDPSRNLLQHFNDLAKKHGIRLVFYRVKRRPDARNEVFQDEELKAYTRDFRAWAESQGHLLIDETGDPRLTLPMYHDGDHLGRHAMKEYTRIFFERVKSALPLPPAGAGPVPPEPPQSSSPPPAGTPAPAVPPSAPSPPPGPVQSR